MAQSSSEREALISAASERRREWQEAGQVLNRVVYDSMVFVPGSADRVPGGALLFESRFESGNLRRAVHVNGNEYDLLLNWDHGTRGHTQWYFFSVSHAVVGEKYIFNIVNFCKPQSLYKNGMRPLVYSAMAASKHGHGWTRIGTDVYYHENGVSRRDTNRKDGKEASHSTLSFSWSPEHANDTLYFAMCYPYTYSDLRAYLARVQADPLRARHVRRQRLALTIAGNECEMLWVTDHASPAEAVNARPVVAISARVHPGESNASWVMQGIIDYLTGRSAEADALRRHCLFLIVPMLNPDGVICGNYRCSLAAVDLNRRWARPSSKLHPTIHALKKLLLRLHVRQPVAVYVDLHGHSRKQRSFMYGCEDVANGTPKRVANCSGPLLPQVFPLLLSRVCGTHQEGGVPRGTPRDNFFSFGSCNYAIKKSKECTARVVVHRELQLATSYTLEASFCGCDERRTRGSIDPEANAPAPAPADDSGSEANGPGAPTGAPSSDEIAFSGGFHFSSGHLQQIGVRFCKALHVYFGLGAPPNGEAKMEEPPGLPSISSIDGIQQLPDNACVHAALIELMQGDVDAGPDGDSEGSDGGDASDGEQTEPAAAPTAGTGTATSTSAKSGSKESGGTTNGSGTKDRVAPPQPKPAAKPPAAANPPAADEPPRNRRNTISTRRTREAEMRAAAQRAEAAAAAAAALLGNRPDLLSGPSIPPPRPAMPAQSRPEHPMPPPPLIQQPSVLLEQQRQNAKNHMMMQQQLQQQQMLRQYPPFQQQPQVAPPQPAPPQPAPPQPAPPPQPHSAHSTLGTGNNANHGLAQAAGATATLSSRSTGGGGSTGGAGLTGSFGGERIDQDDDAYSADGEGERGSSFDRGRGFTGKSLSLRSNQWAARPRAGQPPVPSVPAGQGRQGLLSSASPTEQGRPRPGVPGQPGSLHGGLGPTNGMPPNGQGAPAPAPGAAALKRRPHMPGNGVGGDGQFVGEEMSQAGFPPPGSTHATPFAELIARRGGDPNAQQAPGAGGGGAGMMPDGTENGLVPGLELLVSHVRTPNVMSAGGDGGGFSGRSKSSPVAGRRAQPPSATISAPAGSAEGGANPSSGGGPETMTSSEVDDAIYSFAASLRTTRRTLGTNGVTDHPEDELLIGASSDNSAHDGALASMPAPAPFAKHYGLSSTLPSGLMAGALVGAPGCSSVQHSQNQVRQRYSAREGDRVASSHRPLPFGTEGGNGTGPPNGLASHGNWPPSTWRSCAHMPSTSHAGSSGSAGGPGASASGGGSLGNSNSRPRSVEGVGRPLDPRPAAVPTRRAAYYSQPSSDPRLLMQSGPAAQ